MNIPRNSNQLHYWHKVGEYQPQIADELDYLSENVLVYCEMQINDEVQGVFGIGYCTPRGDWYVSTIDGIHTSKSAHFTVLMWRYLDDPPCDLPSVKKVTT